METWKDKAFHWAQGHRWHQVCASVSGAATGFGGFATTLVDLPVVTTLILRSIQQTALDMGEDISDPEVRAACLSVFGIGGPLIEDDGVDTGLFGARLALTGKSIAEILLLVLPRFGMSVSQKVVLQAAPVLGAVAGAAVNQAFMRYYQEIAKVHFRLRRLEAEADKEQVQACFERIYGQMYPKSLQKPSKRSLLRTLPHLIR